MSRSIPALVSSALAAVVAGTQLVAGADIPPSSVPLADEAPQAELAGYMSQLQIYTHKLSLSIDASNSELAAFYMHESVALLEDIQASVPEYEGIPVAVFVDRFGLPPYARLRGALLDSKDNAQAWSAAMDSIIDGCNTCHASSQHGFIRIERNPANPFMQNFEVQDHE